ncbi:MAG: hypothetical protein HYR84_05760 [Planctomycetes bacterium]|nr:hypothetical protein [Planctomycetota bacterium]
MPASNLPDPDKIPDMSLPPRADQAPTTPSEPSAHIQHPKELPPKTPPSVPAPKPSASPDWQEGDRVLAPWEPTFLYAGVIRQIQIDDARGDQALIEFDDGGEGWVFVYSLCPFEFKVGQQAQLRRPGENQYQPVEVVEMSEGALRIRYDDGSTEWATIHTLRFPCVENGPGAVATKFAPFQSAAPPADYAPEGSGIPSWVIWVGVWILIAILRFGCREMGRN